MIYLDNAATSKFKPRVLFDAMFAELSDSANAGRGGHNDAIDTAIKLFDTREALKRMVGGGEEHELIFTSGCTEALNLAILGYLPSFKERVDVVVTANEHNSTLRPLTFLKNSIHINIFVVQPEFDGTVSPHAVAAKMTPYTKLVCLCHISNVTGACSDVAAIGKLCRAKNAALLVDAAQSLGHVPVDVRGMNVDFLACAGHKGLHGPQGTGFLVYDKKRKLKPIRFGGTGTDSASLLQPDTPPEGFESGTLNSAGLIGLGASAGWTAENLGQLNLHTRYLTSELLYGLKQIPKVTLYSHSNNGVVSFNYGELSSTDLGETLNERDIAVRCGLHCAPLIHKHLGTFERGTVRAAIGYNNTISDVKALLSALSELK